MIIGSALVEFDNTYSPNWPRNTLDEALGTKAAFQKHRF